MIAAEELIVGSKEAQCFSADEFMSSDEIHSFSLSQNLENEWKRYVYEDLDDILDFYSELTVGGRSDEKVLSRVVRKQGALPVSYEDVYKACKEMPDATEPPMKLIVRVAIEHFTTIKRIAEEPKKVLRRDRQLVPIGKVQQIDTQCLRWLAKQPGYTSEEKAGSRQRLMSVIRYESFDTLENRVFKQFLKYCSIESKRYLWKYGDKFPEASRIKAVQRLASYVKKVLSSPLLYGVRELRSVPVPNYTLQNNVLYRIIWELYLRFVNRVNEIEIVWSHRHSVIREAMKIISLSVFNELTGLKDTDIVHEFWIEQVPLANGRFSADSSLCFVEYDSLTDDSYRVLDRNGALAFSRFNGSMHSLFVSLAYIPYGIGHNDFIPVKNRVVLEYNEDHDFTGNKTININANHNDSIIKRIFSAAEIYCGKLWEHNV